MAEDKFLFDGLGGQEEEIQFAEDQASNGYIHSILRRMKAEQVEVKEVRNSDFIEYTLTDGGKQLKMAKCYGFKNIQRVVQAIKKKKCQYSYVEIMACPGGCFSGGGQPKHPESKPKQVASQLSETSKKYEDGSLGENVLESVSRERVTAKYRVIEKSLNEAIMNW